MSDDKFEGNEKVCGNCKTELICVKIVNEWQGKKEEKLQWQSKSSHKAHFKYAGPGKYNCINIDGATVTEPTPQPPTEQKPEIDPQTIKVSGPHAEAELITRWASERAYKITMAEVPDYSKLTDKDKSSLGQKQGMLTRCLADLTIELMKMHGIKTKYGDGI